MLCIAVHRQTPLIITDLTSVINVLTGSVLHVIHPTCDRGLIHQSSRKAGPIIYIQERASGCWRERAERKLGGEKSLLSCSDAILEMTGIIN